MHKGKTLIIGSLAAVLLAGWIWLPVRSVAAQSPIVIHDDRASVEETLEAVVSRVIEEKLTQDEAVEHQKLELLVTKGSVKGETVEVDNGSFELADLPRYEKGDRVMVLRSLGPDGTANYYVIDFNRRASLGWMLAIFFVVAVAVAGRQGVMSILGMALSFLVIFAFVLPAMIRGYSPLPVTLLAALAVVPPTFYLSHGWSRKTHAAIVGTAISLVATGLLAAAYVSWSRLSGHGSEDLSMLQALSLGAFDARGLLLSGIVISLLGVFDDVTVAQAAVVRELRLADSRMSSLELYRRAMRVGKDHIASMVNTLVLVYAGTSLPLLLLLKGTDSPIWEMLNREMIADEIVRALVGSTGLILAVPITTLVASLVFRRDVSDKRE